jgi:Tol biopolymer transport system component
MASFLFFTGIYIFTYLNFFMKQFLLFLALLFVLISACDRNTDSTPPPAATFKLVYVSGANTGSGPFDIYTKEGDAAPVRIINATGFTHWFPRVSPNKQKLLFFRTPHPAPGGSVWANAELWISNADGSSPVKIVAKNTNGWGEMSNATWSPDGRKIVLAAKKTTGDLSWHIFTINTDGSNPVQITSRTGYYTAPVYSPDGSKIACIGLSPGAGAFTLDSLELYTINVNGTGEARLTFNTIGNYDPAWSPDGEAIVFTETAGILPRYSEIKAIRPDGTNLRTVFGDASDNRRPRYNPVGDFVFFIRETATTLGHLACVQRNGQNLVDITPGTSVIDEMVDVIN